MTKAARTWTKTHYVTVEFLRDAVCPWIAFDPEYHRPADAGPSEVVNVHVAKTSERGLLRVELVGRELS